MKLQSIAFCILLSSWGGAITLPPLFSDGMMFQRDVSIPVWGKAAAGELVRLSLDEESTECRAASDGVFRAEFPARSFSSTPLTLKLSASSGTIEIKNILVGDVWFCCGQSNMEFRLSQCVGGMEAARAASSQIRVLDIKRATSSSPKCETAMEWIVGGSKPEQISGVAFFFAEELSARQTIPIGVVVAAVGSTKVEAWSPGGERANAMVAPLKNFPMAGIIYYQGESNIAAAENYYRLLEKCVDGFHRTLSIGRKEFSLLLVQIAPFGYEAMRAEKLPVLQSEQERFARAKGVPLAVISDVGDFNNIHPPDKKTVGVRLARLAEISYYQPGSNRNGTPYFQKYDCSGKTVLLTFSHVSRWIVKSNKIPGFELAGADGIFHKAVAVPLDGGRVSLNSHRVANPRKIRYLWKPHYKAALFNEEGFPVGCFQREVR